MKKLSHKKCLETAIELVKVTRGNDWRGFAERTEKRNIEKGYPEWVMNRADELWLLWYNILIESKVFQEMNDTEKALLNDCPVCGYSFAFAWSEVDADGFCRVTCGGCEEYIEYQVDQVDCKN